MYNVFSDINTFGDITSLKPEVKIEGVGIANGGSTYTFSASILNFNSSNTYTYSWYSDQGVELSNTDQSSVEVTFPNIDKNKVYTVSLIVSNGISDSDLTTQATVVITRNKANQQESLMATYQEISEVTISLQGVGVTAQGFGTPLFASSHRYFPERVRAYGSLTAASEDLPTDSAAYKAVQGYFSNTPRPSVVKVGRREADLDILVATGSNAAQMTIFANDGTDTFNLEVNVTGADEDSVASAIATAIEGDADISPLVVASASGDSVNIDVASPTYTFWVKSLSDELTESYNTTESGSDLLAAISLEDDDYYFFSADDHTDAFVLEVAEEIEARTKQYFFSTSAQNTLTSYTQGAATDILGRVADFNYFRTKGFYHDLADTAFPETTFVGANSPFDAGSVTWNNLVVSLPPSRDTLTGNPLSATQKGYLESRNASYVDAIGGQSVIRNGSVASGEKIDAVRGRDNLQVDMDTAYTNFLLSQRGSKIPLSLAA